MSQAIELPVLGMETAPLRIGIMVVQFVVGVTGKLFFLPESFPGTLALGLAAISLVLHPWIGRKEIRAVRTANPFSHGVLQKTMKDPAVLAKGSSDRSKGTKRIELKES